MNKMIFGAKINYFGFLNLVTLLELVRTKFETKTKLFNRSEFHETFKYTLYHMKFYNKVKII